jgi:acyl carrier protein
MSNSVISKKNPTISSRVRTIIHEKLGVEESAIVDSASFSDDLGLDSLDVLETFMALEKEFNLKISDEDAEKLKTVGSVIDYITTNARRY